MAEQAAAEVEAVREELPGQGDVAVEVVALGPGGGNREAATAAGLDVEAAAGDNVGRQTDEAGGIEEKVEAASLPGDAAEAEADMAADASAQGNNPATAAE